MRRNNQIARLSQGKSSLTHTIHLTKQKADSIIRMVTKKRRTKLKQSKISQIDIFH